MVLQSSNKACTKISVGIGPVMYREFQASPLRLTIEGPACYHGFTGKPMDGSGLYEDKSRSAKSLQGHVC